MHIPKLTIFVFLLFSLMAPAQAFQPELRIERSDDTIWNSLSDAEKMLYVGRQAQYYRDHGIILTRSVRYYANQVEFYRQDPRNLQVPTKELILKSIIRSTDMDQRSDLMMYMRSIYRVHEDLDQELSESFSDYIKSGVFRDFDEKGHVREEWSFRNGRKDGIFRVYYPNGNLFQRFVYAEGRLVQAGLVYYPDGSLKEIEFYDNGRLNGLRRQYYESGVLKGLAHFENGRPVGVVQMYNKDGSLQHEVMIENGSVATIRMYEHDSDSASEVSH